MSASASLSFYRAFLLFYLCILCAFYVHIFIDCHFGVINDDDKQHYEMQRKLSIMPMIDQGF